MRAVRASGSQEGGESSKLTSSRSCIQLGPLLRCEDIVVLSCCHSAWRPSLQTQLDLERHDTSTQTASLGSFQAKGSSSLSVNEYMDSWCHRYSIDCFVWTAGT